MATKKNNSTDIVEDLVELLFWGGFYVASNRNKTRKPVKPVETIHIEEDSSPKRPSKSIRHQ